MLLIMLTLIILFLMSFNNIFFLWLFMTMLSMVMTMIINKNENKLKYFLIQEISILSFIFCILKNMKMWSILPMFLKMGMIPFHTWMLEIFIQTMKLETIIFITLAKVMPSLIIMSLFNITMLPFVITIFLYSQLAPLMNTNNMKILIFFSSLTNFTMIFIFSMMNNFFAYFFLMLYLIIMLSFFSIVSAKSTKQISFLLVFNMLGLPISPLFFMKMFMLLTIVNNTPILVIMLSSTIFYFIYSSMFMSISYNDYFSSFNNMHFSWWILMMWVMEIMFFLMI